MVELRQPKPTVDFIDEYCQYYRNLFSDVRSFEAFKYLYVGMISDIKRKTLPAAILILKKEEKKILYSIKRSKIKLFFDLNTNNLN